MKIYRVSPQTGRENSMDIDITIEQLDRVVNRRETGELIQNIVPHLSRGEREFLISGILPEEWDRLFGAA